MTQDYLHIVNGDAFAEKLRSSLIPGEILVWRESLYEGPVGQNMLDSALLSRRASYLEEKHGIPQNLFVQNTVQQEQALDSLACGNREVVLWFEHDLYDQLMLAYLLFRFTRMDSRPVSLSLLCIGEFPGVEDFRGLGQLAPQQVAELAGQWVSVSEAQLSLGHRVWSAYSASEPLALNRLLDEDLNSLPFMKRALQMNIGRYPSQFNGLSYIQQLVLEVLDQGEASAVGLFTQVGQRASEYGLGDLQFWSILNSLLQAQVPLIFLSEANKIPSYGHHNFHDLVNCRLALTAAGKEVLLGQKDSVQMNGIDDWIGGVHLASDLPIWRRNAAMTRVFDL